MITIQCPSCSEQILLMPDAPTMGRAIFFHIQRKHRTLREKERDNLENLIIKECCSKIQEIKHQ